MNYVFLNVLKKKLIKNMVDNFNIYIFQNKHNINSNFNLLNSM